MQIVILVAFILAMSLPALPAWGHEPAWIALSIAAYLLGAAGLGAANTAWTLRRLRQGGDDRPILRRHGRFLAATQLYLLAGLAVVLLSGFGQRIMLAASAARLPLLGEALLISPFVAAVLVHWLQEYPVHRALRERMAMSYILTGLRRPAVWTLQEYLGYNVRHQLLFVAVPVGLIVLLEDLLRMFGWPRLAPALDAWLARMQWGTLEGPLGDGLQVLLAGGLAMGVFLVAPLLIVRVWNTQPLPPSPLRQELYATLSHLKLRCRDILIWKSGGVIANAAVMGLLGSLRYVLITDALLDQMDSRHLQAIFGHEVGHIVSHHILYSVIFAIASVLLIGAAGDALCALGLNEYFAQLASLAALGLMWWLGFGFVSRSFERQSDVIGAWSVGSAYNATGDAARITPEGAALFAQALEQVAQLNGISLSQRNWRHGTIQHRINYILYLGSTGGTRRDIDRLVRRIKLVLWLLLALALAATAADFCWA